jgi:ATP-dependent RNA helicase RhlE
MAHEDQPPRSHDARAHQNRNPLANPTMKNFPSEPRVPRAPGGQPDPMRTSVDMMAERGARRGGGGGGGYQGKRPNGGGGGFGGAPGGFGGGPRGRGGPGGGNRGPAR